jgi:hypothetical protein
LSHIKSLWVLRELGLPAVVRPCVDCAATRHLPTGRFRVNANGKLLDVWLLVGCHGCGRTSKIPVHERVHVGVLDPRRRQRFEDNDTTLVRELATSTSLASRHGYALDWAGTWRLETDLPFYDSADPSSATGLTVEVRFELPAPVRVERLLQLGFGLSRTQVQRMVAFGRLRLPLSLGAKAREDFTFTLDAPLPGERA